MKIIINFPGDFRDSRASKRAADYARLVGHQLEEGYLCGHVDAETNWESSNDD